MKFERTIIEGMPKKFKVDTILDYLYNEEMPTNPYCQKYGFKTIDNNNPASPGEAIIAFRYDLSATGVILLHSSELNTLTFMVPEYASEADVLLFATLINSIRSKHPRTSAFDFSGEKIKYVTSKEIDEMNRDRRNIIHKNLLTKEGFRMDGINQSYILKVEHLIDYSSIDMRAYELMQTFISIQWNVEEETDGYSPQH